MIYFLLLQAYLKFEQSSGDPARVKSLYERAITEFPISVDLWIDYTHYLNETLKVLDKVYSICDSILIIKTITILYLFNNRQTELWGIYLTGPQETVPGLENYGFGSCYTLKDVVDLRMSFLMYVFIIGYIC